MTPGHALVLALLAAGTGVITLSVVEAALSKQPHTRLHFLTPVTSLGGPLVGLSLAIADGWGLTTGTILLIVAILAITGPVLQAATGRLVAEQQGLASTDSPE